MARIFIDIKCKGFEMADGGICGGDSGGPSIFAKGSTVSAVGLAIHVANIDGEQQCLSKSAFTDLLFFRDWINDTTNQLKVNEEQQRK
jgi:secreted trypsin-like serine protease